MQYFRYNGKVATALTYFFVGFGTNFVTSVRVSVASAGVLVLAGLRPTGRPRGPENLKGATPSAPPPWLRPWPAVLTSCSSIVRQHQLLTIASNGVQTAAASAVTQIPRLQPNQPTNRQQQESIEWISEIELRARLRAYPLLHHRSAKTSRKQLRDRIQSHNRSVTKGGMLLRNFTREPSKMSSRSSQTASGSLS